MDLYDYAIQMSRDGEKFFLTLTREVKKPGLRRILAVLANDQVAHRRELEKMQKTERGSLAETGSLKGVINPFAARLERMSLGERLDENLPPAELYRRGQALDKECENFYREKAARENDPRIKETFLRVAEMQRKHYITLEHLINFILEPEQGLEDREWSDMEPWTVAESVERTSRPED